MTKNEIKKKWQPSWLALIVSLLMTAEYTRLVVTAEEPNYRIVVLVAWVAISSFLIYRRLRFGR